MTVDVPVGYPVRVVLPGVDRTLWWGAADAGRSAGSGEDVVAVDSGRVLAWPTTVECLADTQLRGWACAEPDEEPTVTDLRPLAEWLHGRRFALDPVAALNAWNLADDVARSLGLPRVDRDRVAQRCYNKLVVANVPWLADRETYVPRWTKHEVRCLRRVLGQAAALLGRTLGV